MKIINPIYSRGNNMFVWGNGTTLYKDLLPSPRNYAPEENKTIGETVELPMGMYRLVLNANGGGASVSAIECAYSSSNSSSVHTIEIDEYSTTPLFYLPDNADCQSFGTRISYIRDLPNTDVNFLLTVNVHTLIRFIAKAAYSSTSDGSFTVNKLQIYY